MSEQNPLIVPMTVEAFVVNDHVRLGGNSFLRTQMQYNVLRKCKNGQPNLTNNDSHFYSASPVPPNNVNASDYYNGVYLKWRLPRNYTHGEQDNVSGQTKFPPVPNRWLIVRYSGSLPLRQATAWIVESDYLWTENPSPNNASQAASMYVAPASATDNTPVGVYIGRNVALGTWAESGHSLGLTSMGPGNPAFAFYQPQCNNVFSFIDPLNGQQPESLSYMVFGWFSNASDDPLHGLSSDTFAQRLAQLDWTLPEGTDPAAFATQSLLYGFITSVQWQTSLPAGGAPKEPPSIAIGNTAVEALTALIAAQSEPLGVFLDPELLQAFQLGLIDILDQPDGAAVLEEKIRESYFQKFSGGYTWDIVDAPDATETISAEELIKELTWLAVLNQTQATLDEAIRQLVSLQTQLYLMWWKYMVWPQDFQGSTKIPGLNDRNNLLNQLDPNISGSIAQQTSQQMQKVAGLQAAVPYGSIPEELQTSIDAYAAAHDLPIIRVLKRSAAPRFFLPNNPVVLIAGAGASGIVESTGKLLCRFPSQLVTGFLFQGKTVSAETSGLNIPMPVLTGISGVPWSITLANSLVQEFFFLDLDNAAIVSAALPGSDVAQVRAAMSDPANDIGTYPEQAIQRWTQNPWHPLLLLWQVNYYPIAYGTPDAPNWTFENGTYAWNGSTGSIGSNTYIEGLIQLTPAASFNMESRLKQFLNDNPYLPEDERKEFEALLEFVQTNDAWDLLSQALNGFNDQLRLENTGVFISPQTASLPSSPSLPTLIGNVGGYAPSIGTIPTGNIPQSNFLPWRCGQFLFVNLLLVDEWGQALWPITQSNYKDTHLLLPPDLTPVLQSNALPFTVTSASELESINPRFASACSGDLVITLLGAAFQSGDTAQWNGTPLATTFVSSTELTATVPAILLAASGEASINVARGTTVCNSLPFTITVDPAIAEISPHLMLAGMAPASEFTLVVDGLNFPSDAIVNWNTTALSTTFVNATQLTALVPSSFVATEGQITISIASAGKTFSPVTFSIVSVATVDSISPAVVAAGSPTLTLDVSGVGFQALDRVQWNDTPLNTTFVDDTHLRAEIPASLLTNTGVFEITQAFGHKVLPDVAESLVQLSPALLQPARLAFDFVSATDDNVIRGLAPEVDPICGWVLPNHLDASLMAYNATGIALGELSVGVDVDGGAHICWINAPNSPYTSLDQIAKTIPHFGPFLLQLSKLTPQVFTDFLKAIDETLWTTAPMGYSFDDSMAVLVGRPLAMVRSRLQFQLDGFPNPDPSWQYTFTSQTPQVTTFEFAIELGNVAQLEDGLIGYFTEDDYSVFNIVQQADAASESYLRPIGVDNNYIYLPFDNKTVEYVSMLVDPRAAVHAITAVLPDISLALPPEFVTAALAAMNITIRVDGILTDQQITAAQGEQPGVTTILMPVPKEKSGTWTWIEYDGSGPVPYPIAPNDTVARMSNVQPVLRRGLLQLSGALDTTSKSLSRKTRSGKPLHIPKWF